MADTSGPLISSKDVTGTAVYGRDESKVGTIDHVMIDKTSGKVAYALMSFGGVFGIGDEHREVPWGTLTYDKDKGGFVTGLTKEVVEGAPRSERTDWYADRAYEDRMHAHYGISPYYA